MNTFNFTLCYHSLFSSRALAQNDLYFGDGDYYEEAATEQQARRRASDQPRRSRISGSAHNGPAMERVLSSNEELFVEQIEAFEPKALQSYLEAFDGEEELEHGVAEEELHHNSIDSGGEGDSGEIESGSSDTCIIANTMPLCVSPIAVPTMPLFDFTPSLIETLKQTADRGDMATCVTAVVVLGDRIKNKIPVDLLEHWFLYYIDLLQRLQLFNRASVIMQRATQLPRVQQLNQNSTVVTLLCPHCQARLPPRAFCCRKCSQVGKKKTAEVLEFPVVAVFSCDFLTKLYRLIATKCKIHQFLRVDFLLMVSIEI